MHSVKFGYLASVASRASLGFGRVGFSDLVNTSSGCVSHFCVPQARSCQTGATVVIRVPRYVEQRIDKLQQTRGKNKINTVKPGRLLIRSKNPVLNQSVGYILGKFEEPTLCSKGWKHNKSFGDYFIINNTKTVAPYVNEGHKEDAGQSTSGTFTKLKICKELVETLSSIGITNPTTVQLLTIPKVMKGHNVLCAAETGSGKTLSYLLPIVQKLRALKLSQMCEDREPKFRTLILVPSRELAEQVASVSRTLCTPFGLVTQTVGGGRGVGKIKLAFQREPADVLVATPGALVKALHRQYLDLSELNFFVVDEADTMFDPSFSDMVEKILHHTNISVGPKESQGLDHKAQLLVVGATFPAGVGELLSQVTDLGAMVVIKSKMLHYLMPHVKQTFLKVKGADKILELHQAIKLLKKDKDGGATLVFCNKSATVNWLGFSLDEMGVQHKRLQGEMPAPVRTGVFQSFQNGTGDVLVCTDIASRGLDTSAVRLVVNYDFPESHTDYIHRAGRVGRAGGAKEVEVISFVTHPWDVELVQKIEMAARRRTSLPGMESQMREPKPKEAEEVK